MVRDYALVLLVILSASSLACERQHVNVGYDLPDECPSQCVRLPPLGFDGPALLWFGPAEEAPECPVRASTLVFDGGDAIEDAPLKCADYPERHIFYASVEDSRECTQCKCTPTAPSECIAVVSSYQDASCTDILDTSMVATTPACRDIAVPNAELGSLQATWDTNNPGACEASGGESIGEAKITGARTFCCQPPPGDSP